jgi:hypothetical protein
MKKFALVGVLILSACTTTLAETPKQKVFAAIYDYKTVQKAGMVYKSNCEKMLLSDKDCKVKVVKIKELNNKANFIIQAVDTTIVDVNYSLALTHALQVITQETSKYLQTNGDEQ